jgi:hypothetical protein
LLVWSACPDSWGDWSRGGHRPREGGWGCRSRVCVLLGQMHDNIKQALKLLKPFGVTRSHLVIFLITANPKWTMEKVAEIVGMRRTSLYDNKIISKALKARRAGCPDMRKGRKDNGFVEAVSDEPNPADVCDET